MEKISTKDIALAGVGLALLIIFAVGTSPSMPLVEAEVPREEILPKSGVALPIRWEQFGKKMVEKGVIDREKLDALYNGRGGLTQEAEKILSGEDNERLIINEENAGLLLNVFWAFGFSNKNPILEAGPMVDARFGGDASRFASTGGWVLARGNPMDHYSKYEFVKLTDAQQASVERVSQNIYRPCCGNSTYFPDCNHGMAMLGLLELMAANNISEEEIYRIALAVNSFWFPDTYLTIATYFAGRGVAWEDVEPKDVLGSAYSSLQGYQQILTEVEPPATRNSSSCGV
jgi:hypothetical protein